MRGLIVCPACGADRLIPLTFGAVLGNDRIDPPRRPAAKCADCGERSHISAKLIGRSRQTKFPQSAYTDHGPGKAAVTTPSSPWCEFRALGR